MKTILFIGQAPARPLSKHEVPGTYLHSWLHSIGVTDKQIKEQCHFYALTNTFPGGGKNGHLPCLPFSHPSDRNTWNALHKEQVSLALAKLKQEIT